MAREIKFRVWDKGCKVYDGQVGHALFYTNEMHMGFEDTISKIKNNERFVIEQYTGKEDRNGVGIYENDIVFHEKTGYGIVYFDKEYMCFDVNNRKGDNTNRLFYSKFVKGFVEVVGNINKNKELLKEEN